MSDIEWTSKAYSVVRGCSRASEGCDHCYSARLDGTRLRSMLAAKPLKSADPGEPVFMGDLVSKVGKAGEPTRYAYNGTVFLDRDALIKALKFPRARDAKVRTIFWNHRSDTFHERLMNEEIAAQFGVFAARPDLHGLFLTKRAKRMREWFAWLETARWDLRPGWEWMGPALGRYEVLRRASKAAGANWSADEWPWPLPNVGLGVSVETPAYYDRIRELQQTPAAMRFLSLEPALADYAGLPLDGISWVIVGCESGPGARHAPLEWVRSVRDQVLAARTECRGCNGAGYLLEAVISPGGTTHGRMTCSDCHGRGWTGPSLFIKQMDVCEHCSGRGYHSQSLSGELPRECTPCRGTGQTGKVRKGNPAIDGKSWAEFPPGWEAGK